MKLTSRLIRGMTKGGEAAYFREVVYEIFGQELESLPEDVLIERGPQPRSFTMIRRVLDRSRACIVHSRFAEEQVRLRGFQGRIAHIPHGARVRNLDGSGYRARLGIRPEEPLVGMFGYQRPDKQACDGLLVFRAVLDKLPSAKLVIAGLPHPEVPLEERIKVLRLEDSVRVLGFQTLEDLDGYIAACDVVLNLRSTTFRGNLRRPGREPSAWERRWWSPTTAPIRSCRMISARKYQSINCKIVF